MNVKPTGHKHQTIREAGYEYVEFRPGEGHVLRDVTTGNLELWFANKGHASAGLTYKNTDLEFARSV